MINRDYIRGPRTRTFALLCAAMILLLSSNYCFATESDHSADNLRTSLRELDDLLDGREKQLETRTRAINSLKRSALQSPNATTYRAVAEAYIEVNNDSALYYLERAVETATPGSAEYGILVAMRSSLMPIAGFIEKAKIHYESVDTTAMSRKEKAEYYGFGAEMYRNITAFYANYPDIAIDASRSATQCIAKMLSAMSDKKDTPEYRMAMGEYLLRTGKSGDAEKYLRAVYDTAPVGSRLHTRASHMLSHVVVERGDEDGKLNYLVHSVMSGLTNGAIELQSMQDLGMSLYKRGDEHRAYRYLSIVLDDAAAGASWIRMIQVAQSIPVIQESHVDNLQHKNNILLVILCVLVIVIVALGITLIYMRRFSQRQMLLKTRLASANTIKEVCIAQFVSLCSVYMDRLTQFSDMVNRKISAGKIDDIVRMLKSGKFINEQGEEFFRVFDAAFLQLFPTFIEDVNRLMRDDSKIELKEGEKMNTDLRILAFMRMGIDDCSRIAQILNYSLNTIYAYRNKLKQRATNRNTFEEDVMKIQSI